MEVAHIKQATAQRLSEFIDMTKVMNYLFQNPGYLEQFIAKEEDWVEFNIGSNYYSFLYNG